MMCNMCYYAMPIHGVIALKVGIDNGGAEVTADQRSFTPDELNMEKTDTFVKRFLPKVQKGKLCCAHINQQTILTGAQRYGTFANTVNYE